jgi:hypothetical protein
MASSTAVTLATGCDERSRVETFAMSLLTFSDMSIETDGSLSSVIVNFDEASFMKSCKSTSPNYDENLSNFEEISSTLFCTGYIWQSRDLLFNAVCSVGKLHGFERRRTKEKFVATGSPRNAFAIIKQDD